MCARTHARVCAYASVRACVHTRRRTMAIAILSYVLCAEHKHVSAPMKNAKITSHPFVRRRARALTLKKHPTIDSILSMHVAHIASDTHACAHCILCALDVRCRASHVRRLSEKGRAWPGAHNRRKSRIALLAAAAAAAAFSSFGEHTQTASAQHYNKSVKCSPLPDMQRGGRSSALCSNCSTKVVSKHVCQQTICSRPASLICYAANTPAAPSVSSALNRFRKACFTYSSSALYEQQFDNMCPRAARLSRRERQRKQTHAHCRSTPEIERHLII